MDEVCDNDDLYFAEGESFISKESLVNAAEERKIEKLRFIEMVTAAAVIQATKVFEATSGFAKEKGGASVKNAIESVENQVSSVVSANQDLINMAIDRVQPVVNWANDKIDVAYALTQETSGKISQYTTSAAKYAEATANRVNSDLRSQIFLPLKSKVVEPASEAFFRVCTNLYVSLDMSGKSMDLKAFIDTLRLQVGEQWNDKLQVPASMFFEMMDSMQVEYQRSLVQGMESIQQLFASVRSKLGSQWEQSIIGNFKERVVVLVEVGVNAWKDKIQPTVYSQGMSFYTQFHENAQTIYTQLQNSSVNGQVSLNEFVVGIRAALGVFWNEKLMVITKQVYDKIVSYSSSKKVEGSVASASTDATAPETSTAQSTSTSSSTTTATASN
jgi:hypothetical protein